MFNFSWNCIRHYETQESINVFYTISIQNLANFSTRYLFTFPERTIQNEFNGFFHTFGIWNKCLRINECINTFGKCLMNAAMELDGRLWHLTAFAGFAHISA